MKKSDKQNTKLKIIIFFFFKKSRIPRYKYLNTFLFLIGIFQSPKQNPSTLLNKSQKKLKEIKRKRNKLIYKIRLAGKCPKREREKNIKKTKKAADVNLFNLFIHLNIWATADNPAVTVAVVSNLK